MNWAIRGFSATNQHHAKKLIQDLITELLNGEEYYTYHSQQGFKASFLTLLMSPGVFSDKDRNNDVTLRYTAYHLAL